MKRIRMISVMLLLVSFIFAGCGAFTFEMTRVGNDTTIEIVNAKDGKEAETDYFTVGKNEKAVIDASLEKGKLAIDFVEADVFTHVDAADEIIPGDIVSSAAVEANDHVEVKLDAEDYIMCIKTMGETSGKVTVKIVKAD